jgi:hypothetical protein
MSLHANDVKGEKKVVNSRKTRESTFGCTSIYYYFQDVRMEIRACLIRPALRFGLLIQWSRVFNVQFDLGSAHK